MADRRKTCPGISPNISMNIVLMFVLLSVCKNLAAADWVVQQEAVLTSPEVSLSQVDSTSSNQAINSVVLGLADSLTDLNQTATITGDQLTIIGDQLTLIQGGLTQSGLTQSGLTQSGLATNSNVQAVNLVSANSIDQLTQSAQQNSGTATLTQNIVAGTGNIQAINYAASAGNINNANQTFVGQSMLLQKTATTPEGNIQAVNYSKAIGYTGSFTQSVTLDSLNYSNLSGDAQGIRINSINGDTGSAHITQTVTIQGVLTVGSDSDPRVIINHIGW